MAVKRCKLSLGVTMIEVMVAIVIVATVVLGTSGYRYYSALDVRKAAMQSTAARIALLLCENWRGRGLNDITTFDPVAGLGSELEIDYDNAGGSEGDFTRHGAYTIQVGGVTYYATMAWVELGEELRALNVAVSWAQRQSSEGGKEPAADKSYYLTTFVAAN